MRYLIKLLAMVVIWLAAVAIALQIPNRLEFTLLSKLTIWHGLAAILLYSLARVAGKRAARHIVSKRGGNPDQPALLFVGRVTGIMLFGIAAVAIVARWANIAIEAPLAGVLLLLVVAVAFSANDGAGEAIDRYYERSANQ
jgi:hypothetical protein